MKPLKETVIVTVDKSNTVKPVFKKFGYTSGFLKYFTTVKPGTHLKITIEEIPNELTKRNV